MTRSMLKDIEKLRADARAGKSLKRLDIRRKIPKPVVPEPFVSQANQPNLAELVEDNVPEYREIITGAKFWYEEFDCYHLAIKSGGCLTIVSGGERPPFCFAMDDFSNRCPYYCEIFDEELD